jgi:hypothetical protein
MEFDLGILNRRQLISTSLTPSSKLIEDCGWKESGKVLMTEPTPNTPSDANVSDDQVTNFSWWLCMLPFFAAIGFFVWRWFQMKSDVSWLMYAAGALIIGLVFTALVSGAGSGTTGDTN